MHFFYYICLLIFLGMYKSFYAILNTWNSVSTFAKKLIIL